MRTRLIGLRSYVHYMVVYTTVHNELHTIKPSSHLSTEVMAILSYRAKKAIDLDSIEKKRILMDLCHIYTFL